MEGGEQAKSNTNTNTHTHTVSTVIHIVDDTHTHTHSVTRDTHDGLSLGQGSDTGLTHVSVAHPLMKLTGNEHREHVVGVEGAGKCKHPHTECPP